MIIKYLKRIAIPYMLQRDFNQILLIIDEAGCHLTDPVKQFCNSNSIYINAIPGRMTNLLQPADICWFSSIKKSYKAKWMDW